MKKVLLSGVKPTGIAHIGNYFGAMKQFVDLQNSGKYQCYFMIADYHGLNLIQDKEQMKKLTLELAIDYLAIGLDPKASVLFRQSDVSAHTELTWIFDSIVPIAYLARAHAFKAAVEKFNDIAPAQRSLASKLEQLADVSVGTFNYPVLMAADILLYDTDVVPVGQDQKQHVEYARDIALKFNDIFGGPKDSKNNPSSPVFKLPEHLIIKDVAVVAGIDGRKMSKSYGNTISLFAERDEIIKSVMSIVTDSNGPESGGIPTNVYNIHKLFRSEGDLKELYEANKGKYKILKEALIEDVDTFLKPLRERRARLARNEKAVVEILKDGGLRAKEIADRKLIEIKKSIGVL